MLRAEGVSIRGGSSSINRVRTRGLLKTLGAGNSIAAQILTALFLRLGDLVTTLQLIDFIYGADDEGGPDDADGIIKVLIAQLRRAGFQIETVHGYGYRLVPTRFVAANVARFVSTEAASFRIHSNAFPLRKRQKLIKRYRAGEPIAEIAKSEAVTVQTLLNHARAAGLRRRGHYTTATKARIVARVAAGERFKTVAAAEKIEEQTLQLWLSAAGVHRRNELWFEDDIKARVIARCRRGDKPSVIQRDERVSKRTLYRWRYEAGLVPANAWSEAAE